MYEINGQQDCEMQNKEERSGQPLPFDPLWEGPMKVTRRKTDPRALKFYWIFLTIWIGIGIYAFGLATGLPPKKKLIENNVVKQYPQLSVTYHNQFSVNNFHENKPYNWNSLFEIGNSKVQEIIAELPLKASHMMIYNLVEYQTILGCSILTVFLSVMFIAILSNYVIIVVKGILGFLSVLATLGIIGSVLSGKEMILLFAISLIVLTAIVIFFKNFPKDIYLSCEIIKSASKIVFFSPFHLVLPFVQFFLSFLALMFFLNNIRLLSNAFKNMESYGAAFAFFYFFLHLCNFIGWIWSSNFIHGVVVMILSGSFSTWYWTENKEHVPKNTVQYFASLIQRFHLGTSAVGSIFMSICDVIDLFSTVVFAATSRSSDFSWIFAWFLFWGICLLYFVMYVSRKAYLETVLFGTDFYTSVKNTYHLMKRNYKKIAITYVSLLFFTAVYYLAIPIPILIAYKGLPIYLDVEEFKLCILTILCTSMLARSFLNVLEVGVNNVLVNILVDYEKNDGSQARPYYMSNDLKTLM